MELPVEEKVRRWKTEREVGTWEEIRMGQRGEVAHRTLAGATVKET